MGVLFSIQNPSLYEKIKKHFVLEKRKEDDDERKERMDNRTAN